MPREPQPASTFESGPMMGKVLLATTVVATFSLLIGFGIASSPDAFPPQSRLQFAALPSEAEYRNYPDASHNNRIFELREKLTERGFLLNGVRPVSDNPLAVMRGTYGLLSPHDDLQQIEWRLMGTRSATCEPGCFLRIVRQNSEFTSDIVSTLEREWMTSKAILPPRVLAGGTRLLEQLRQAQRQECAMSSEEACFARAEIVERRWICPPQGAREFRLRLRQVVDDYDLEAELREHGEYGQDVAYCEVTLHFTWLTGQGKQVASAP